jgi:hypothetical protein
MHGVYFIKTYSVVQLLDKKDFNLRVPCTVQCTYLQYIQKIYYPEPVFVNLLIKGIDS